MMIVAQLFKKYPLYGTKNCITTIIADATKPRLKYDKPIPPKLLL